MEDFNRTIHNVLSNELKINWLIVHEIAHSDIKISEVDFSFVDGKERYDEPFNTNQGFISIKNPILIPKVIEFIEKEIEVFNGNLVSLANIYIIISRISYKREDEKELVYAYKNKLGVTECERVYEALVMSANKEAYNSQHLSLQNPQTTDEWLKLFRLSQYSPRSAEFFMTLLNLVDGYSGRIVNYSYIKPVAPFLRSGFFSFFGMYVYIAPEELDSICTSVEELSFLSALLLDDYQSGKTPPKWMSEKLITIFIDNYWQAIGCTVFRFVYGINNRNKVVNDVYHELDRLCSYYVIELIKKEDEKSYVWIDSLSFPNDFIALSVLWDKVKPKDISDQIKSRLFDQFLEEMGRILDQTEDYLTKDNKSNPFITYNLHEHKYQLALAYIVLFSLSSKKNSLKVFKNLCFRYKDLYYGGFYSRELAIAYTEIVLLAFLYAINIEEMSPEGFSHVKSYLKIISDSVLIPYIHLTERHEDIWNPASEKQNYQFNAGRYFINLKLSEIVSSDIKSHYEIILTTIDNVKVAQWPFERMT